MYEDTQYSDMLLEGIREVFTEKEIAILEQYNVPLYGPNGIRKELGRRSIKWFIKLYFPDEFTLSFAPIHLEMISDIQEIMERQLLGRSGVKLVKAIPRGHAKSTFYARVMPLHGLLYDWSKLTVLLGNNDDAAKRLVVNIRRELETNELIKEDFPTIKGKQWGNERLESETGSAIVSFGIGSGSIRGVSNPTRPTLIIGDDIDDDRSVRSAVELAANKDWFDKSVLYLGDNVTFTTSFVIIGTVIRNTSLLKYIIDSPDFEATIERSVKSFAVNVQLWEQWEEQILTLARENIAPKEPEQDTFYQENKEKMLEGTVMLWDRPDAYYRAMISKLRNEKAFWSELQNNPKDSDGSLGAIRYVSLPVDESEYELLAALDPTIKGGKTNDLAAYVEVLFHRRTKTIIVSYIDAKQRSYSDTIDTIVHRIKIRGRKYDGFWIETNGAGDIIMDLMRQRFWKENIFLIPNEIYSRIPKAERISVLSEYTNRGQLVFADNLPEAFHHEVSLWPVSQHDDVLDAISQIIIYLKERGLLDLLSPDYNVNPGWINR